MCAIVGAVVDIQNDLQLSVANKVYNHICERSIARGRDGRGVAVIAQDWKIAQKSVTRQESTPGPNCFRGNGIQKALANFRAEPTTEYVSIKHSKDQQPYSCGAWVVVHNGTIANDRELRTFDIGTKIDSAAIPEVLHEEAASDFAGFVKAIKKLKGSYAIVASHQDQPNILYLAVNYRPLWYITTDVGVFVASSEAYFPEGIIPKMVEPYTAMEIEFIDRVAYYRTESLRVQRSVGPQGAAYKPRALVVCSGGLDSVVAATQAQRGLGCDITLLHFQYGCRSETNELAAVSQVASDLDCGLIVRTLPVWQKGDSPLLDKDSAIAGGEEGAEFAYEWVPARNLVMLSIATALAEAKGYDYIVLGNNLEEAGAYPDNEPEFINRFNAMLPFAVGDGKKVEVIMPVGNLMKHEIVKLGLELNAPMENTWSCYRQGEKHCGKCGPCFMRKTAFEINGSADPVM